MAFGSEWFLVRLVSIFNNGFFWTSLHDFQLLYLKSKMCVNKPVNFKYVNASI